MKKSEKIVEEITKKRKMTHEVKSKLIKKIALNAVLALGIVVYITIINIVFVYAEEKIYTTVLQVFSMIFIFLTVGIFEFAYKKDSGGLAIFGIELMAVSIMILYIQKIYMNLEKTFSVVLLIIPIICIVYYIAKSIIMYIKTKKEYQNNLSDVKQIRKEGM